MRVNEPIAGVTAILGRLTVLEGQNVRSTRFSSVSGTSGSVTLPANSTVILDDFGGTVDALVTTIVGGRSTFQPAQDASGNIIATTFDSAGAFVLSGTPSAFPVAIIYRVKQTLVNFDGNTATDIIGDYDSEDGFAIGGVVTGGTAGAIPYVGATGLVAQSPTTLFRATDGSIGIGTGTPNITANTIALTILSATTGAALELSGNTSTTTSVGLIIGRNEAMTVANKRIGQISFAPHSTTPDDGGMVLIAVNNAGTLSNRFFLTREGNLGIGATPAGKFHTSGAISAPTWTQSGIGMILGSATYTDTTASGGAAGIAVIHRISTPTIAATNVSTFSAGVTLYLAGAPTAGTNVTLTGTLSIFVDAGDCRFDERVSIGTSTFPAAQLDIGGAYTQAAWGTSGVRFRARSATFTDSSSSGTIASVAVDSIAGAILAASSSTTFTQASTLYIIGPPTVGANVAITNAFAITVAAGDVRFNSRLGMNVTPTANLDVAGALTQTAWGLVGIQARYRSATYTDSSSSGTVAASVAFGIDNPTFAASSVTTYTAAATFYVAAQPTNGTNVTITSAYAVWVDAGDVRLDGHLSIGAVGASPLATLDMGGNQSFAAWGVAGAAIKLRSTTYTDTTSSGVVASAVSVGLDQLSYAASSSTTFTTSATLYVVGPPTAGTNVTLTTVHSLWIDSGTSRFDGNVAIGATAFGASATAELILGNGTAPSGNVTDANQIYSADAAAGDSQLFVRNESGKVKRISGNMAVVTTQFDKAGSTALANVTGLTFNVQAGTTYFFRATLFFNADVTGGHKYAISGTATATSVIHHIRSVSDATNLFVITSRQTTLGGSAGQAGSTAGLTIIEGTIVVNAAGTLTVQFAQNAATGTSSILVGSTFEIRQDG